MVERNGDGRFAKGNSGGPGRPSKKREERFYGITLRACTFKDWREIVKTAVRQAKTGDTMARKFLADYIIGPPAQRLALTGADGVPLIPDIVRIIEYGSDDGDGA